jgi:hypothetical protein
MFAVFPSRHCVVKISAFVPVFLLLFLFFVCVSASPSVDRSYYVGGASDDTVEGVTIDLEGNVIIVGSTSSVGWATGGYDTTYGGSTDGYVMKRSSSGAVLWIAYLGGSGVDSCCDVAVDASNRVLVVGATRSSGWISGGYDTSIGSVSSSDGFVVQLNSDGSHSWSAYLGGSAIDTATDVAVDSDSNVWVTGATKSTSWISGGYDTTYGGSSKNDGYIVKLSATGSRLWSTYFGGSSDDVGAGVAIDSEGYATVVGSTKSTEWVSNGYDMELGGTVDACALKVSPSGEFVWATYIGGSSEMEDAAAVAMDATGNAYVVGYSGSDDWVSGGADTVMDGYYDGFVMKISPSGQHLWSSYIGGGDVDSAFDIAVDDADNVYVVGDTTSGGWTTGGFDTSYGGGDTDGFLARYSSSGSLGWSSYLGGSLEDSGYGVAVDNAGCVYATGKTLSTAWENGGFVTSPNEGCEGFLTILRDSVNLVVTTIEPKAARDTGAQWSIDGGVHWRDSGTSVMLPSGDCEVSFKAVSEWNAPTTRTVTVANDQTVRTTGTYTTISGGLCVTIEPEAARKAGAKWRRVGTSTWLVSGATESELPIGSCSIEFASLSGWDAPVSQSVAILNNAAASVSGTYIQHPGSLAVTIEPKAAREAGAKWRRVGTSTWLVSGATETNLPVGNYTIEFAPLEGWNSPATQNAVVASDSIAVASGTYLRKTGSLCTTIVPEKARLAGAKWRRVGTSTWFESGATESDVPTGNYSVEFATLIGWFTPPNREIVVVKGDTTETSGTYAQQASLIETGSLRVTIEPEDARSAGAGWRCVGTSVWLGSGAKVNELPVGTYTVEFEKIAGWDAPTSQTVEVLINETTEPTGTYVRQTGSLAVTIAPESAREAGGMWRRTGTTEWLGSGAMETGLVVGSYTIEFLDIDNWTKPDDIATTVEDENLADVQGVYEEKTNTEPLSVRDAIWVMY